MTIHCFFSINNYSASYVKPHIIDIKSGGLDNISKSINKILPLFCYILGLDMTLKKLNNSNINTSKIHNGQNISHLNETQQKIFKIKLEDQKKLLDNSKKYIETITYYSTSSIAPIIRNWHADRYIPFFKYSLLALIGSPLNNYIDNIEDKIKNDDIIII